MIGRSLAHYRITAAIGTGGMGEVFRATDTRLGREVALKVLPAEMATDPERLERFQREAKALAALDHPGIVGVFSVEEADGIHFLTMQLVSGQSLAREIPKEGLPLKSFLQIATAPRQGEERYLGSARESLDPEAARQAAAEVRALSLEDACALAHRIADAGGSSTQIGV